MSIATLKWSLSRPLNSANANSVPESGAVYILSRAGKVFYVGQSNDLRRRLREHLSGDTNPCVARQIRQGGASFRYALVARESDRLRIEQQLIRQQKPMCNG